MLQMNYMKCIIAIKYILLTTHFEVLANPLNTFKIKHEILSMLKPWRYLTCVISLKSILLSLANGMYGSFANIFLMRYTNNLKSEQANYYLDLWLEFQYMQFLNH